jgi:hypothetical protein
MTDQIGAQYPQPDPRGWLVFHGLPQDLQRAEDSTQYADIHRASRGDYADPAMWDVSTRDEARAALKAAAEVLGRAAMPGYSGFVRPATDTEKTLLTHLGYALPDPLYTIVTYKSTTLRCRTWPQLKTQEVSP